MITLPSALASAVAQTITRPGYLVEIGFSTPVRLSTLGDVSWGGHTWQAGYKIDIQGLGRSLGATPRLSLGNNDLSFGALVLNEGAADKAVRIYAIDAGAPADAVAVFDGIADAAEIGDLVIFTLAQRHAKTLDAPRKFIGPSIGLNHLRPANSRITLGAATYVLQRN